MRYCLTTLGLRFLLPLALIVSSLSGRTQSDNHRGASFQLPEGITEADYVPGMIVVKVRPKPSASSQARTVGAASSLDAIREICQSSRITSVIAPSAPLRPQARTAAALHPLANIYKVETDQTDIVSLINRLQQLEEVVYAEPYYLLKPLDTYVPNDPAAESDKGEQDYLATVHAYEAWAIEKGSADMIIGILDTGVEFGHQDLTDNLYVNAADPINGIDDDGDGYTDNYVGWDMADHDNDPTAESNGHGTLVAGVAAATPDNGVGIAGIGFHSSYMPIKIFRTGNNAFAFGYEAIAYAADRGCKVINLSWGGANAYSRFGEEIINYAVLEKDAVVVAAAGNSGKDEKYYPASYERVLSVAVTDAEDKKVSQTTHNYWVDMVAPGNRNYSTKNEDGYSYSSGSSFAAPLVAGAAALVRAHYPQWSAMQVMQQLRLSADAIDGLGDNHNYREKLGRGRLNAARALHKLQTPAIRVESFAYANHAGSHAFFGDTITLDLLLKNYLSPAATNVMVTLSTESEYITLLDSVTQLGALDSLAEATNTNDPFRIYLHHDLPANEELIFRLGFSAGAYQDYQYISIISSSEYALLDDGTLSLSIGSNGDIGYNPSSLDMYRGVQYQQQPLAPQLGVLLATDVDHVSDNSIQSYHTMLRSQDFVKDRPVKFYRSPVGGQMLRSSFTDAAAAQPVGVTVEQTWLADTGAQHVSFLISEYRITNTSGDPLTNLQTALFADWNVEGAQNNRADWDATHQLGYVYESQQRLYSGVALLTDQSPLYHAIDRQSYQGNVADTEGEFTDAIKYGFVSQGVNKTQAGTHGSGNDVAQVVGATIASLAVQQATHVSFALVVGTTLEELQQATQAAQVLYQRYRSTPTTLLTVPVCTGQKATITVPGEATVRFYRDALGTQLLAEGASYETSACTEDTAIYVAPVRDGYEAAINKIRILITEPLAHFSANADSNYGFVSDTLFLDESDNYALSFWDESQQAVAWEWDFGNDFRSTLQHPTTRFMEPGNYTVTLMTTSEPGCTHQTAQGITVVRRAARPMIADQVVCPGSTATLQAQNSARIAVYRDKALTEHLFTGEAFVSNPIEQSTDFFVVNAEETIPSLAQRVQLRVSAPTVSIHYALDTTELVQKYSLLLQAKGDSSEIRDLAWYVNEEYMSDAQKLSYDFAKAKAEGKPIDIRLTYIQDSAGLSCQYQVSEKIDLSPSPAPDFSSVRLCQGESATLQPTNGKVFYFYEDEQLDSLVHKGQTLVVDAVAMDQTFYVTNMSGLRESESVAIQVVLNNFAGFHMSTDTLYLSETNEAVFEAYTQGKEDSNAISWQWDLGDGKTSHRTRRVTQRFDSAGTYQIRLLAQTAEGCRNTVTRTLVVENVTDLRPNREDAAFRLYPNPTSGQVLLENRFWFQKDISLRLYTLQGQELARSDLFYDAFPLPVDLHRLSARPLPGGLYLLHVHRGERVFVRKLYIKE